MTVKDLQEKSGANLLENRDLAVDSEAKLDDVQRIKIAPFCYLKRQDVKSVLLQVNLARPLQLQKLRD